MAGNTAAIDRVTLRLQWASYQPMAEICTHWTISKDQLISLRDAWGLPKRHDRSRRYKPPRPPKPGDAEELASQSSLSLAPQIAERVTLVQSLWTAEMRFARQVNKSGAAFSLRHIRVDDLVDRFLGDEEEPIVEID
jgi:hypothetical protein